MPDLSRWYAARQHMVDAVRADLYGSATDEYLTEEPLERYIVGVLHPRSQPGEADGGGVIEDANETPEVASGTAPDADYDPGVAFAHLRYPSTIGLTFGLHARTTALAVEVSADVYEPCEDTPLNADTHDVATRQHLVGSVGGGVFPSGQSTSSSTSPPVPARRTPSRTDLSCGR